MVLNNKNKSNFILLEVFVLVFTLSSYFPDNRRSCTHLERLTEGRMFLMHSQTSCLQSIHTDQGPQSEMSIIHTCHVFLMSVNFQKVQFRGKMLL